MLELEKYGEIVCECETWAVGGDYGSQRQVLPA